MCTASLTTVQTVKAETYLKNFCDDVGTGKYYDFLTALALCWKKGIWVWLLFSSWTRAIRENTTIVYRPFATKRESLKIRINDVASLIYNEKKSLIL